MLQASGDKGSDGPRRLDDRARRVVASTLRLASLDDKFLTGRQRPAQRTASSLLRGTGDDARRDICVVTRDKRSTGRSLGPL